MKEQSQYAVAYVRTATKDFSGDRLNKQAESIRSYCCERKISLVAIFEDNGVSGSDFNRPGWRSLKSLLASPAVIITHLLVDDLTRLGRNLPSVIREMDELEKAKIAIHSIGDGRKQKIINASSFIGEAARPPLKKTGRKV